RRWRLSLYPVPCPLRRMLKGTRAHGISFESHRQSRGVHHNEHIFEAAIRLTDQISDRAVPITKGQYAGGARVDPELVLDRHATHFVSSAERAIIVDEYLGHDE